MSWVARAHIWPAGRVDAERERKMGHIAGLDPGRFEGAREPDHGVANIIVGAGIEERLARHAAGAPILANLALRRRAEIVVELIGGQCAELVLGQDRDLAPLIGGRRAARY
jgi:hypothetical protein